MKLTHKNILTICLLIIAAISFSLCLTSIPYVHAYNEDSIISTFYASDGHLTANDFETGSSITVSSTRDFAGGHNDLFALKINDVAGESKISFEITNVGDGENDTAVRLGVRANEVLEDQFDDSFLEIESVSGAEKMTLNEKDCAYIELDKGESAVITIVFSSDFTENTALKFSPYAFGEGFVGKLIISDVTIGEPEEEPAETSPTEEPSVEPTETTPTEEPSVEPTETTPAEDQSEEPAETETTEDPSEEKDSSINEVIVLIIGGLAVACAGVIISIKRR